MTAAALQLRRVGAVAIQGLNHTRKRPFFCYFYLGVAKESTF